MERLTERVKSGRVLFVKKILAPAHNQQRLYLALTSRMTPFHDPHVMSIIVRFKKFFIVIMSIIASAMFIQLCCSFRSTIFGLTTVVNLYWLRQLCMLLCVQAIQDMCSCDIDNNGKSVLSVQVYPVSLSCMSSYLQIAYKIVP